ncbi:VanZ family protein [Gordonibacter massiliensis (ex Traore et al. 2017)]|nr:VanZ family protein [Gordonibacter massiliensis (ex Traore et al. 2017)]
MRSLFLRIRAPREGRRVWAVAIRKPALNFVLKAVCVIGLGATLVVIFLLTEQTPEQTLSLSGMAARFIADGVASLEAAVARIGSDALSGAFAWLQAAGVRRWAHTAEFFAVGLFSSLTSLAIFGRSRRLAPLAIGSLAFSVACSLFDQTHKLFVPGREFDAQDLLFDAFGYVAAVAIVFAVGGVCRMVRRRLSAPPPGRHLRDRD